MSGETSEGRSAPQIIQSPIQPCSPSTAKRLGRLAKLDLQTGVDQDTLHSFSRQERRDSVRFVDFTPDLQEALKTRWFSIRCS